jgi:large subunit ribosomal protein L29
MDAKELRSKTADELAKLLNETQREMFNIRIQASVSGQYKQMHVFKKLRRLIARIKTILHEGANK